MSAPFHPHAVYTLEEIQELIGEKLSVDHFLKSMNVRRQFKYLVLGRDIVEALENAPPETNAPTAAPPPDRTGKRGRPRKSANPALQPIPLTRRER